MLLYKVVFILLSTTASIVFSEIEVQKSWSWQPIMTGSLNTGEQTNKNEELLVTAASEYQQQNYTQVDQVVDKLFVAGREGRNVDGFNEVYSDPTIQQALQNGDDTQARNLIKDKLCNLGLMQCEGGTNEGGNDAKRRFLPPDQLIYAQPPPPYRKQAYPPSKGGFNNNNNNNYNHQKVGYISKPIYGGSGPPFDGAIYGSKPPGPIYDGVGPIFEGPVPPGPIYEGSKPSGSFYGGATGGDIPPYKFENVGENVHYESNKKYSQFNQHETQHFSHEHEKPTIVVNAQGGAASTTGGGSGHKDGVNSVNIHHHYHHLDGGDGAGIAGGKGSIVNPILTAGGGGAVGGGSSLTSGYASGESNYGHLSGTSLNSIGGTTGYGGSNTGFSSVNSGFSAVNGGFSGVNAGLNGVSGYGSVNGVPGAGGIYGSGVKPVFEEAGAGGTFGTYSAHVPRKQQFNKFQGTTGFGGNQQLLQQQQQLNNFNGGAAASNSLSTGYGGNQYSSYGQLNKYSNSPTTNYFNTGENSNSNNYQEFDIARQGSFGGACVCVPYDRCPAHDIIGRRDDLILPLDPRNLGGKNIEALSDDVPSTNGTNKTNTNNKRDTKDSETQETEKSEVIAKVVDSDSDLETKEKSKITDDKKKITKRDVSEKSTAAVQSEGEARLLGGLGGNGNGNGGILGGKKIVPTVGVSFGLPYPSNAYGGGYPISPYGGGYPLQNPHFGAISPNGLNLGLINVNPLVSLQLSKNEYGDKLLKPFVNLHVTPNEQLIHKVGALFKAKKYAAQQALINQHYHTHSHAHYPPPPDVYYPPTGPHHHNHHQSPHYQPHPYEQSYYGGPSGPSGIGGGGGGGYGLAGGYGGYSGGSGYGGGYGGGFGGTGFGGGGYGGGSFLGDSSHYRDGGGSSNYDNDYYDSGAGAGSNDFSSPANYQFNPNNNYYSRSANISQDVDSSFNPTTNQNNQNNQQFAQYYNYQDVYPQNRQLNSNALLSNTNNYANNYENYNNNNNNVNNNNGKSVSFPNSRRRKRNIVENNNNINNNNSNDNNNNNNNEILNNVSSDEIKIVKKRQAPFYQQQQQQGQRFPQQQCGPQQVCCRQPNQQQQQRPGGQCGKRNAQGINGRIKNPVYIDGDSEFGEYPWQAAILKKDAKESVYVCGGTLIDDLHIITAAHCIKSYSPHDLRVRLGEWDVNHDVEFYPYIERDVVNVNIHPEYYAGTLDNDLAVLRLAQPVQYGNAPHISPACLPDKYTDFSGSRCWTTGWGKDAFGDFGKYQNILKEVDVPIINQQQCQQQLRATRLGYNYKLNPGFICAGGEEGKDACKGDGGGPLVCEKAGTWHVVGVVSWGIGCGQVNVPGVYVRVSHYLDWIQQITHRFK